MKKFFTTLFSLTLFTASIFAAPDAESDKIITSKLTEVTDVLIDVNADNTQLLLVTPDAYIGKFIPSIPMHFSAGIALSAAFLDSDLLIKPMNEALNEISSQLYDSFNANVNLDFDIPAKLPVPTAAARLRLGGFFAPFDAGLFGITTFPGLVNNLEYEDLKAGLNYTAFGADFRYCVLEEGILLPGISVGGGYIFTKESMSFSGEKNFTFEQSGNNYKATINSDIDLDVTQHNIFAEVQASKKILIFVPYIGVRYNILMTEEKIDWSYNTTNDTGTGNIDRHDKVTEKNDFNIDSGIPHIYGGIGFNLGLFQLACNLQWNPKNNYVSAGINFDFKK